MRGQVMNECTLKQTQDKRVKRADQVVQAGLAMRYGAYIGLDANGTPLSH